MIELKPSCESCILSKVKCSREKPVCARCRRTARSCTYLPRKRRKKQTDKRMLPFGFGDILMGQMQLNKNTGKRINFGWRLMEDLIKKFGTGSGVLMFDIRRHFRMYQLDSRKRAHIASVNKELKVFEAVLAREQVNLDDYFDYKNMVLGTINNEKDAAVAKNSFSLFNSSLSEISPRFIAGSRYMITELEEQLKTNVPCLKLQLQMSSFISPEQRSVYLSLNEAFTKVFGKSHKEILLSLEKTVSGYLPLGTNIISLLAPEDEILKFLELQCIKMRHLERPTSVPWYWEIPSVTVMRMNALRNAGEKLTEDVNFLVTTCIRYLNERNGLTEEIFMSFKPLENLDHLFPAQPNVVPLVKPVHIERSPEEIYLEEVFSGHQEGIDNFTLDLDGESKDFDLGEALDNLLSGDIFEVPAGLDGVNVV
eukprot:maker-scaffold_4-snap-gene-17.56-mRNA-1 protein AED:0.01 eAED:0.01 QI:166/1/1/1/1/1/3/621/423